MKEAVVLSISEICAQARIFAVVGLSPDSKRTAYGVAGYLQQQGYRIISINPS